MNDNPRHSFIERIENRYGHGELVLRFFRSMLIPVPETPEFYSTSDDGYAVFVNDAGCSIRIINHAEYPAYAHPHILQPLASKRAGPLRIDIIPGIICPSTEAQAEYLYDILKRDGFNFSDVDTYNCGILPQIKGKNTGEFPVTLDPGAVYDSMKMNGASRFFRGSIRPAFDDATGRTSSQQEALYGKLYRIFDAAWPLGKAAADPVLARIFWQECIAAKNEGALIPDWSTEEDSRCKVPDIADYAARYTQRWRELSFV